MIKREGIEKMCEWDGKFKDKREGDREAGPSAEVIERGSRDIDKAKGYGLCDNCVNFELVESNGTSLYTLCTINRGRFKPNKIFPVTRCSSYWNVGWLAYNQLKSMAWRFEINKNQAGFIKPEPKAELELLDEV